MTVTPEMFDYEGTIATDATVAIQRMFDTDALHCHLPNRYRISGAVYSTLDDRTIDGPGLITSDTVMDTALIVTGDRPNVCVNIDGNNKIARGIKFEGSELPNVFGGRIRRLFSQNQFNCAAIYLENTYQGARVRNLIATDIECIGNGVLGMGPGYSRGVAIGLNEGRDPTGFIEIGDCHFQNIIGDEGDAVAAVSSDGAGTYYNLDIAVQDCGFRGFSRRAVKIQGSNVLIEGSKITNDWTSAGQVPNAANVIDFVQGANCTARDNWLHKCKYFTHFSVYAVENEKLDDIYVLDNLVTGLDSSHTKTIIFLSPSAGTGLAKHTVARGNIVQCGKGRAIAVGKTDKPVIGHNITSASTDSSVRTISTTSAVLNPTFMGNVGLYGTREEFLAHDGTNAILIGNVNRTASPLARLPNTGNGLIANNVSSSGSINFNADTLVGNRFGPNYSIITQDTPGALYTTGPAAPNVQLAGLDVGIGQIVWDITPSAGGKIGWTATTSGDAASVTWKQFGAIDA